MALLCQIVITGIGAIFAARVAWSGPRYERSLTGDSREEALWRAALVAIAVLAVYDGWPSAPVVSPLALAALAVNVLLTLAYEQAYWWTGELSPKAKRVMDTTCRLPEARRMLRCWIWSTAGCLIADQYPGAKLPMTLGLAMVGAAALRNAFLAAGMWHLASRSRRFGRTPWDRGGGPFDIFLSYRRTNANVIRRIAEGLLARGVRVWFDEYLIRTRDRGVIRERLASGIATSERMVIFANDSYAQSIWCCEHEFEPFVKRRGAGWLIPVALPSEPLFVQRYGHVIGAADWRNFPREDLYDREIDEAIAHICAKAQLHRLAKVVDAFPLAGSNRVEIAADGCAVTLDIPSFTFLRSVSRELAGKEFRGVTIGGASDFYAATHAGFRVGVEFAAGLLPGPARSSLAEDARLSDTELMEHTREFAAEYIEAAGHRDIGVHTVVAFGFRHFSLTMWNTLVGAWARKYSIVVPHPRSGENFEVVVTFTHFGTFEAFLSFAPAMETIVRGIEVRSLQ